MAHLLHIDSSARIAGSISRQLTAEFAACWGAGHPDGLVTYRDLVTDPLLHIRVATAVPHPYWHPIMIVKQEGDNHAVDQRQAHRGRILGGTEA